MITVDFELFLVVILPAWAVYRVIEFLKERELNIKRETIINIFFIYILSVVYLTFFPIAIPLYEWNPSINMVPIKKTISMIRYGTLFTSFKNVAGNILLLYPIGLFLPLLFVKARSMKKVLAAGFLISVSIEAAQLMTAVRKCDIDDLILNTIGALAGYITYIIVRKYSRGFSSMEGLVESKVQGSLLSLAAKPVAIMLMLTMLPCLISFYDNTYSVNDYRSLDQSIFSKALGSNPDDSKIEEIMNCDGYKIVLASTKNEGGTEEINVYVYRNVIFNRVAYMAEGNIKINGSQSAYSSLSFMLSRDAMLNVVYGKNPENLAAKVEVTRGAVVHSLSLSEQEYFISASAMKTANSRMQVRLIDKEGNNVTGKFYKM